MKDYLKRVAIAFSVLFNVLCGGYSNQTFSARNHDLKRRGLPNVAFLIDWFYYVLEEETDHCLNSWAYWYTRKDLSTAKVKQIKLENIHYQGIL